MTPDQITAAVVLSIAFIGIMWAIPTAIFLTRLYLRRKGTEKMYRKLNK